VDDSHLLAKVVQQLSQRGNKVNKDKGVRNGISFPRSFGQSNACMPPENPARYVGVVVPTASS
jgi:hypothetical protein